MEKVDRKLLAGVGEKQRGQHDVEVGDVVLVQGGQDVDGVRHRDAPFGDFGFSIARGGRRCKGSDGGICPGKNV